MKQSQEFSGQLKNCALGCLPGAVLVFDAKGQIAFSNDTVERLWPTMVNALWDGGSRYQALLKQVIELAPDTEEAEFAEFYRRMEEKHLAGKPYVVASRDGRFLQTTRADLPCGGFLISHEDITDSVLHRGALERSDKLKSAIVDIQRAFMREEPRMAFARALDHLKTLTDSEYGFIGEVLEDDETGASFLRTHAITNIAWDDATRKFYDDHVEKGLEFRNLDTLFGHAIVSRETVIANNAPNDGRASGVPPGHPPLNAFLGVPAFAGDELIGMFGLANRPGGYDEALVEDLSMLTDTIAQLILTNRERNAKIEARLEMARALKTADAALSDLSAYQAALDHHSIVAITDRAGRIEFVNDAFCEISGYTRDELIGQNHRIINSGHHPNEFFIDMWRSIASGAIWRGEICNRSKFGETYWVDTTIFPMSTPDGQIERFISIRQEVTHRKVIESQLREAKLEAETANHAKSQFLANMSHEIRTPLNGVIAIADLLAGADLKPGQKEMVNLIRSSGSMLERLLNDILDLSRIEAGQLNLTVEPFDVADAIETVCHLHEAAAAKKGIDFRTEIDDLSKARFLGDQLRFRQIVSNLISNAIKFTEIGEVVVRVRVLDADEAAPTRVRVEVEDTGIGFDPENSDVFGRFVQADSSITRSYGGTGLGLSISQSLADMMGGAMSASSAVGKGSCFTLTLPMEREQNEDVWLIDDAGPAVSQERRDEALFEQAAAMKVLCAEDHPANQKVIQLILDSIGMESTFVTNGREALDAVKHVGFDLILLDMQMPEMDGLTAAREIRKLEHRSGQPRAHMAMISANALDEHIEASLAAGCDLHLSKPLTPEKLISAIRQLVSKPAEDCGAAA